MGSAARVRFARTWASLRSNRQPTDSLGHLPDRPDGRGSCTFTTSRSTPPSASRTTGTAGESRSTGRSSVWWSWTASALRWNGKAAQRRRSSRFWYGR